MCTSSQAMSIFREVYSACDELFDSRITDAYLYGSYARGDYHEDSDMDILLAVNLNDDELSKYRRKLASITSDLSLEHDITISVTVKPAELFHQYINVLPYYTNVVQEGIRYAN